MCGAPLSQEAFAQKGEKKSYIPHIVLGGVAVLVITLIVVLSGGEPAAPFIEPPIAVVTETQPPAPTPYYEDVPALGPPHLHITDPGLRQALELAFGRELHSIEWEQIEEIKGLVLERDEVVFYFGHASCLDSMGRDGLLVRPDAEVQDLLQLRYFKNLDAFALGFGQVNRDILLGMPNTRLLAVPAGRTIADLTPFAVLPGLESLEISGRNLTGLQGISDLTKLYALGLTGTGITDLSILNQQRNVTALTLTDNRALGSFNTLQEMTWLRSLHIERSTDRDLHFISNLENLEALTLIRTDTRTYNFILPLTNLRYLRLFDNRDVPEIPNLAVFTQLEELHLDAGRTTGTVRPSDYLEGLTSVRRMTLHNPDALDGLRGMQYLEELFISFGWLFTDAAPLGDLTNLRRLQIYNSRVFNSEVRNMDAIARLSNLRYLNIANNDLYFYWDFLYTMENLVELDISGNNVVGNFSGIGRLTNLRVLRMSNINIMSSFRIRRDGGMTSIYFVNRSDLGDYATAIANLTQLEILSISGNDVRDIGFVSGMSNLQRFIAENNFIEDVSPLAELPELVFVDLRRNAVGNWGVLDDMINTAILGR